MRHNDTMVGAATATGRTGKGGSSTGPQINTMAARLNAAQTSRQTTETEATPTQRTRGGATGRISADATATGNATTGLDSEDETPPFRPPPITAGELRALRADGLRPTSTQLNGHFVHLILQILHETDSLLLAEHECEKRNIVVEESTDLTLISDIEAFHNRYVRISEMDNSEVLALRKYTMQHNRDSGTLCERQQPRLRQLYDAMCNECTTLEASFEESKDNVCSYIERTMKLSARPLRSECLRVSKLAQTTFVQSIRDYETLLSMYYRLARVFDGAEIRDESAGWDNAEQEDVDWLRSLLHDVDKKIAELSRLVEEWQLAWPGYFDSKWRDEEVEPVRCPCHPSAEEG